MVPRLNWTLDGGDTVSSESAVMVNRMAVAIRAPTTTVFGTPPWLPVELLKAAKNPPELSRLPKSVTWNANE